MTFGAPPVGVYSTLTRFGSNVVPGAGVGMENVHDRALPVIEFIALMKSCVAFGPESIRNGIPVPPFQAIPCRALSDGPTPITYVWMLGGLLTPAFATP